MKINNELLIKFINDIIENGDIPLRDSYTWKESVLNGSITALISFIGIFVGGKFAINQYKKQEAIRLQKEIEFKDYQKCTDIIVNILKNIYKIKNKIEFIYKFNSDEDKNGVIIKDSATKYVNEMESLEEVMDNYQYSGIKNIIEDKLIERLKNELNELKLLAELKMIYKYDFIYDEELNEINYLNSKFIKIENVSRRFENLKLHDEKSNVIKNNVEWYKNSLSDIFNFYESGKLQEIMIKINEKHRGQFEHFTKK